MLEKCDKYITKIQIKGKGIVNEPIMAEYIRKTIPRHNIFFAPVIHYSPVHAKNKGKEEFASSKTRCVGEKTIVEHLLERMDKDPLFLSHLLDTHLHLTLGLEKLVQANMVHLNIHENNILFNDKIQSPILTEFGLSSKTPIDPLSQFDNSCLELHLMSDMAKISNWEKKTIHTKDWEQRIEIYFEEEMMFVPDSLKQPAIKKWKLYIQSFNSKKGKQIWSEWSKYWETWDNYNLLKIYASILHRLQEEFPSCSFLDSYNAILTSAILLTPDKRDTPAQTISKLDSLVSSLDIEDLKKWIQKVGKIRSLKNEEN